MLPAPSLRVMVDGDILALQGRIQQLHDEAKALLGAPPPFAPPAPT